MAKAPGKASHVNLDWTPGLDQIHVTRVEIEEGISRPFRFRVEGMTSIVDLDPDSVIGTTATIILQRYDLPPRHWSGTIRSAGVAGTEAPGLVVASVEIVPKLWFLGQTDDCRIWYEKTAQQIITDIFNDMGITDVEWRATGLPTRHYTVQHHETDWDFVCRLLEEEGCFFFFKHSAGAHKLCIANANSAFVAAADGDLTFHTGRGWRKDCSAFRPSGQTVRGEVVLRSYNLETPTDRLQAEEPTVLGTTDAAKRKFFEFSGTHKTVAEGRRLAKIRMEAFEAQAKVAEGSSFLDTLGPGYKFTLDINAGINYVVKDITHRIIDNDNSNTGEGFDYFNTFTCFADTVIYRAPQVHKRPNLAGVYNALVVTDEDIVTEQYGRIKVQFLWDRLNTATSDSVWVRLVQTWAGADWGFQFIPRKGMEVAIVFMNGNPDYPVCIGCLVNADHMPPFALPGQKTRSGIRTRSTPNGAAADFNELSFEDKAGNEEVFLHAQKNLKVEVENDESRTVDNNRTVLVKNDESETIGNSRTIVVQKADNKLTLDQGNHLETVKMGNHDTKVDMGNIGVLAKMGNIDVKASLGNISIKASVGSITLEALQGITLKVGTSTVKLDMSGVKVEGIMTEMKGTAMATVTAPMTQVKGDGMVMVKGGIVMIN